MEDCNCHTKKTTLPSLEGNATAEKALSELTATDFNNENGMKLKLLLKKLDKHGLNSPPPPLANYKLGGGVLRFQNTESWGRGDLGVKNVSERYKY